jgi:microcystin-dependent protein
VAETTTTNYAWTMPDPGASANTWGSTLNATTQKIDAQVYTNQQAGVPVGAVTMFVGTTAPTNWLLCQGQSLSTTTYAGLFAVIGYAFGGSGANFNLPDLLNRYPIGASPSGALGSTGGSFSVPIAIDNLPAHDHPASQVAHTHSGSQDAHSHSVYQDAHTHADTGHGHGVSASQDPHTHTIPSSAGGGFGAATPPSPMVANQGSTTTSGASANNVYVSIATGFANIDSRQPAVHADVQQPAIYIDTQQPAVSIGSTGGDTPLTVVPPYQVFNFIIRYQ